MKFASRTVFFPAMLASLAAATEVRPSSSLLRAAARKLGLAYWQTCKGDNKLRSGEKMAVGQCLCAGDYQLCMDEYGALALLSDVNGEGYYVWETPVDNPGSGGGGDFAKMQRGGNLSVRRRGTKTPVWKSGTGGNKGAELSLDKQGIATIKSSGGDILWAEYERGCKWVHPLNSPKNQILEGGQRLFPGQYICRNFYRFGMDEDGNLGVFYRAESQNGEDDDAYDNDYEDDWDNHDIVVWSANTGDAGLYVQMKKNGNLIVYDRSNQVVWCSKTKTDGDTDARLELNEGGEIQIINDAGSTVWSEGPFN